MINIGVLQAGSSPAPGGPPPNAKFFAALIDTGATRTCISPKVAAEVGLVPTGAQPMASAAGPGVANTYIADLVLPFGPVVFGLRNYPLGEFKPPEEQRVQILLGRDILCKGHFTLGHDGHFSFSL
ncbi:MAG: retroviral-like aspartic protease family protein [Candidatus Krumholzibacteriia bacterium]